MSKEKKLGWYNSGNIVTSLIIAVIVCIIVSTQSFANNEFSLVLFSSVINRNSIYLLVLIYFIFLKFSFGKKYFNYMNVILIFIYFIVTITSLLTMIQFFSLNTVLNFSMNVLLLVYLVHTFFRDTRVWKEFHLNNSPFNELTNENYYYAIIVISLFSLAVNLISTVDISGVVVSTLNTIFLILFGRYIYLYRYYLDKQKLDSNNTGNFNDVREKIQDILDKTDIDDKIVDGVKNIQEMVDEAIHSKEEKDLDELNENQNLDVDTKKKKEELKQEINEKLDLTEKSKSVSKKKVKKGEK